MPEKKTARRASRDDDRSDLFLLQERIKVMDARIRRIHRWVMIQKVIMVIKLLFFLTVVIAGVTAYSKYFPIMRDNFLEVYTQMQTGLNAVSGNELPFDIQQFDFERYRQ